MTGHLSYLAANERVSELRRAANKYRAAKVTRPAQGSQREAAARVRGRSRLVRRRFKTA